MQLSTSLALALLACCAGCASPWTVDRYEAPEGNLPARQAFFLKGGEVGTPTAVDPGVEANLRSAIESAIATELTRKGYTQVPGASGADFVVSYQVAGTRKFVTPKDRRVGAPSPTTVLSPAEIQPPPASAVPREQTIRDGTVIVFADDPASGRLIWRGLITAETRVESPEAGVRTAADMAHHIVQEFPARQPAK